MFFLYEGPGSGERREQFKLLAVECLVPQEPQQEDWFPCRSVPVLRVLAREGSRNKLWLGERTMEMIFGGLVVKGIGAPLFHSPRSQPYGVQPTFPCLPGRGQELAALDLPRNQTGICISRIKVCPEKLSLKLSKLFPRYSYLRLPRTCITAPPPEMHLHLVDNPLVTRTSITLINPGGKIDTARFSLRGPP